MSVPHLLRREDQPDRYQEAIEMRPFDGKYDVTSVVVTLALALGFYNSIEMVLLIFITFKRWKGLYFWSMNLCNLGVILYSLGLLFGYFELCVLWLSKVILDVGWIMMIFFQSLVLYSRLNLILEYETIVKIVKWYIIIGSTVLIIPTIVLDFGSAYSQNVNFARAYFYMEYIQLLGFSVQEVIISLLYVWKTIALLSIIGKAHKTHTKAMVWQLMVINIAIILMDVVIIVLQFEHFQLYQEAVKGFVYSVKLKLELNILSKLIDLVHAPQVARRATIAAIESSGIIDSKAAAGEERANMHQEMDGSSGREFITSWLPNDQSQTNVKDFEEGRGNSGSQGSEDSQTPLAQTAEGIARLRSQSVYSARLNNAELERRKSDVMYADMLRSIAE